MSGLRAEDVLSRRARGFAAAVVAATIALLASLLAVATPPATAASYGNANTAVWQTTGGGEVRALATDGTRIYLGGSFAGMRADAASATVAQPFLAAVDAQTGALDTTFAPDLNGDVRTVELSSDGSRLYVGGFFSMVNGAVQRNLVALDPITGATIGSFAIDANNGVLDIALDGGDLYAVGRFSVVNGTAREKVVRVDAATGAVDATWAPASDDGNIEAVEVDPVLDRVYLGGFFDGIDGVPNSQYLAAVSRSSGAVQADWDPAPDGEVYDIHARPGRLWTAEGGVGGQINSYDTISGARLQTYSGDGDLQVVTASGPDIVAGGHHENGLGGGVTAQVSVIDGVTEAVDPSFDPVFSSTVGIGVWSLLVTDSDLWVGGAITSASPVDAVGIARYPVAAADPPDTTPPTDPTALAVDGVSDLTVRLSWTPGTDADPLVEHVILRDGIPLGAVRDTTFIDAGVTPNTSYDYTILAVDTAGNISNAAPAVTATTLGPLSEITPIALRSTWRYLDTGPFPAADWRDVGFDDAAWSTGDAELGVGDGNEVTVIANRTVNLFRRTFTLTADQAVAAATLRYLRDDGVTISINGTEVVRNNVPAGPIDATTVATDYVFGSAESELFDVEVDPSLFVAGDNVVAVSLHNGAGSTDMSFDASLTLRVGSLGDDTTAPTAPTSPQVSNLTEGSARITWGAATDNVSVVSYEISRGATVVGTVPAAERTYTDGGLAPSTSYDWTVRAVDAAGNVSPDAGPVSATTTAVPVGAVEFVGADTVWDLDDSGLAPPADWTTATSAPPSWRPGTTEIGVGDGGETTLITAQPVVFLRTTFDVGDPSTVQALTLDLLADDGAVAYLNGTEVVRDNVAPGPVDQTTPASTYRFTVEDETTLVPYLIPAGLLQSGPNVLAVSVHQGPGSTDVSFDAALTGVYQDGADTEPPAAPTGVVAATATATSIDLSWSAAFDNVAVAEYRVSRDGVEVGVTPTPDFTDTGLVAATSYDYTVVAVDLAGNVGPPSALVTGATAGAAVEAVTEDAVWRYLDTGVDPGPAWATPGFDDTSWPSGAAELGAGDGGEATVVSVEPVVWFRTSFDVQDVSLFEAATLRLLVDDGAVVYVNGTEVLRDNIGAGALTSTTPALSYRWTTADETTLNEFPIPIGAVQTGTNTLAIRVHQGLGSSDLSLIASLTLQGLDTTEDTTPPTAPGNPVAGVVTDTEATLSWTPATDDVAVASYEVLRDGVVVGTSVVSGLTDTGLTPSTTYDYEVRALDAAGNVGTLSASTAVTTLDPQPFAVTLVAENATWRYLDSGNDPGPDWVLPGFDDAAWPSGPAELGIGDGGEATPITVRPTVWFRTAFTVADLSELSAPELHLLADDGAVVYLNGVEIVRDNVPAGPLTATTPASTYRWSATDESTPNTFSVPFGALVAGPNTLAVRVHQGAGSTDLSFLAELTATGGAGTGTPDTAPPSVPGAPAVDPVLQTTVGLAWTAATDDVGVARYEVLRDGAVVATTASTTFTDTGLLADTAYTYRVQAVDAAGNIGAPSVATSITTLPDGVIIPDFTDDFSSGSLSPTWPVILNATVVDEAARISPANSRSRIATLTSLFPQDRPYVAVSTQLRFDALPPLGTTADGLTIENQAGSRNFDLFLGADGQLWFDLFGADNVQTGIVPVVGQWLDIDVIVHFGASTYEAWVEIDGQAFQLSSPGATPSLVRQVVFGTWSTTKTYQFDVDSVAILTSNTMPDFLD